MIKLLRAYIGQCLTYIKWAGFAALMVLCLWFGRHYTVLQYEAQIAEQNRQIAELQEQKAKVTVEVVTKYVDRVKVVQSQADAVIREVPVYVTQAADARCVIPVGFVRVHDEAATGVPVAAGDSNEAASGIALSAVAETIADNYGTCRETAEQLKALQEWVRSTR